MAEVRLTKEGASKYEERLEYLKTEGRANVAEQIKEARGFGDLSENAEYDAAKLEQAHIEREILDIENMLRNVVLIDEDMIDTDKVDIGSFVRVKINGSKDAEEFQIMGSAEASPMQNRISDESPIGKGLMGKKAGDKIEVMTPSGVTQISILEIHK